MTCRRRRKEVEDGSGSEWGMKRSGKEGRGWNRREGVGEETRRDRGQGYGQGENGNGTNLKGNLNFAAYARMLFRMDIG